MNFHKCKYNITILALKKMVSLVVLFAYTQVQAQVNYVRTFDATAPEQNANALMGRWVSDVKTTTQYIDGLGRPIQTVIKQGSLQSSNNEFADMVAPIVYDEFGREPIKYLPFAANTTAGITNINNGSYKVNALPQQQAFATTQYPGETQFYSKTNFEPSPLNRPTDSYAPGNSWAGSENAPTALQRNVQLKYYLNTIADDVKIWNVTNDPVIGNFGTYQGVGGGYHNSYPAGELFKIITVDEHKKQVIEFKDKEGKVILKKVQLTAADDNGEGSSTTGWLCTYYIYDDLSNLRCVIQPEAVKLLPTYYYNLTSTLLDQQCFRYEYDYRNRMIKKKVPGAGEVCIVYDSKDRLVMTQDANMRSQQKWMYTTYDIFNRPASTGLIYDPANYNNLGYHLNAANSSTSNYPNIPTFINEQLSQTFYDGYSWLTYYTNTGLTNTYNNTYDIYFQTASNTTWPYPQANAATAQLKGMITGARTKVIGTANTYLYSLPFYDEKGRPIQSQSTNITGGIDISTTQYTWAGQPLVMVSKQQALPLAGGVGGGQTTIAVSQMTYDDLGRVIKTEKKLSNTLVDGGTMAAYKTIAENKYDKLGQLVEKRLAPTGSTAQLETQKFEYNIRGWLLGMNRGYAKEDPLFANNYFGFDLGYDKTNNNLIGNQTYTKPQYNGNIEGTVWRSKGDGEKRKYDYDYDAANRLLKADFTQYTSGTFNQNAGINFNVKMGDGIDPNLAYDYNGNIKQMQQWGLKINASSQIDNLKYTYIEGTNKLKSVTDFNNDAITKLGDFKTNTTHPQSNTKAALIPTSTPAQFDVITDYNYDLNGNMNVDNNKNIGNITYNHLNLPQVITIPNKGSITYTYDAAGNKLTKTTAELPIPTNNNKTITTTTNYINGLVYESKTTSPANIPTTDYADVLQFVPHEEGRIRPKALPLGGFGWGYDYMLKDHLGNVRVVITDEQQQDIYPAATLEDVTYNGGTAISQEQKYYDINPAKVVLRAEATGIPNYTNQNIPAPPNNNQYSNTNANSAKLYKLNSTSGLPADKMGLGVTLKVMAGDRIDVAGKSYYFQQIAGQNGNNLLQLADVLTGFLGGASGAGATAVHGAVTPGQINPGTTNPSINNLLNIQSTQSNATPNNPRAFINVIFFDEQFNAIDFRVSKVGDANVLKENHLQDLQNLVATKSGFVYVYVSNESPVNVFFDNVQVVHTRGAMLSEDHYYPFGLVMKGISSRAAGKLQNKIKFNGKEEQSGEFSDGSGLEWTDYKYRFYDYQIGRFFTQDLLADKYPHYAPYQFAGNQVPNAIDLDGLEEFRVTNNPQIGGASMITYDPTPIKNLQGNYQVVDAREGANPAPRGFFPEQGMQKNLGGSFVNGQGNLYIKGDDNPGLADAPNNLRDFSNPITGDNNPRDGNPKDFLLIFGASAATPTKLENQTVSQVTTASADQSASGTFQTAGNTVTVPFSIPASSTPANVSLLTNDGGAYRNNFNVQSGGTTLTTIRGSGTGSVTAPGNSTLNVQVTGVPRTRADIYSIDLRITTTTTQQVPVVDYNKLKQQ